MDITDALRGDRVVRWLYGKASGRIVGELLVGQLIWSLGRVADLELHLPLPQVRIHPSPWTERPEPNRYMRRAFPRICTRNHRVPPLRMTLRPCEA